MIGQKGVSARIGRSVRASLLMATTALSGIASLSVAQAQTAVPAPALAQARQRTFDIPPQPLADALAQFGRQSGMQVSVGAAVIQNVASPGVRGSLTPDQALTALLSGTGITYRLTGGDTAMLERLSGSAIPLPTIAVEGAAGVPAQAMIGNLAPEYAGRQVARGGAIGVLGNKDMMDTPFNQTSYTAKKVEDQHARVLTDVLIDNPSVQIMSPRSGSNVDLFAMRGFLYQSVLFGGLPSMMGSDTAMPELAERIEVLTGPSAMLNGNLGMGGTVNVVPKRAGEETLMRVTPSFGSTENVGGHVDIGHRFGPEKQIGVRFNGVYRDGETAVKDISDERALLSLGLDYRGERLRLAVDLGYQMQDLEGVIPRLQLAAGAPVPTAPNGARNPGVPWSYKDQVDKFAVVRGEFDVTDSVTGYATVGRHDWQRDFLSNRLTITSANGNANGTTTLSNYQENNYAGEAGVRTRFDTGPVGHEFITGAAVSRVEWGIGEAAGPAFTTNIYSPATIARPTIALPDARRFTDTKLSSLFVADTLSILDKRAQLTLGVRDQKVDVTNYDTVTGAQASKSSEKALSPSVGLLVKPLEHVSLYGNFIQGLEGGEVVGPTFANSGTAFPPYKTKQYEAGVKVDWGVWTTTASVFEITRPSVVTNVAANTRVLDGEQRNRGLELNVFGEPFAGIRLLGGAMFLDPELTKTQGGATDGWQAPSAPDLQLRLSGEWDTPFMRGLTLTGRVLYTGEQYIDTLPSRRKIADWTRLDLGARYTFENAKSPTGRPVTVRFNVDNVFGEDFWMSPNVMAAPRTFWLSTTFDF